MPAIQLTIDDLVLDQRNPRSTPSSSQREALQKILTEQEAKLAELAESIVEEAALNPMERILVLADETSKPAKYIVLEGNRRAAALKILTNPAVLSGLEVRPALKRRMEAAAQDFDRASVEPIDAFEISRDEAEYWLRLRHTGENQGRGIVDWSSQQQARFIGSSPALQAVEFVQENGNLSDEELRALQGRYITTVKRLLESPDVRALIGVELRGNKLLTTLPADEVIRPLKRMVLDLAQRRKRVTALKLVEQMIEYVEGFGADLPDLAKAGEAIELGEVAARRPTHIQPDAGDSGGSDQDDGGVGASPDDGRGGGDGGANPSDGDGGSGTGGGRGGGGSDPSKRNVLVPKGMRLKVTDSRIAAIYNELRKLKLKDAPNAISVLFRVFIELSVDH
ncbi:MAG: hypothetical protein ACEQSB_06495 [Undibacterium sp.]